MGWELGLILPGLMADIEEVTLITTIEIKKIIIKASTSAKKGGLYFTDIMAVKDKGRW